MISLKIWLKGEGDFLQNDDVINKSRRDTYSDMIRTYNTVLVKVHEWLFSTDSVVWEGDLVDEDGFFLNVVCSSSSG